MDVMRWLNPAAFVGLAALVLPVLIHLFSRKQTRVVPFPSLRFVAPSPLLPTRKTQVSDIVLLLVRMAILAAAAMALAGPLITRSMAAGADSSTVGTSSVGTTIDVRALVIDTANGRRDSVARYAIDTLIARLRAESNSVINLPTSAPFHTVPGAVDWLQQQPGSRELVVVSDFRSGALDSTDLTAVPRDIAVRLVRIPAAPTKGVSENRDAVVWWSDAPPALQDAMRRAVVARGGHAMTNAFAPQQQGVLSRVIVVTSSGTDSAAAHLSRATTLRAPWMGNVLEVMQRDTTLAVAMASVSGIADTLFASPFVVTSRSAQFAALVGAAALPATDTNDDTGHRLLLVVRTPDDAVATAALLLAASRALRTANDATVAGSNTGTIPSDEQLRSWERASSAPATPVRSTLRTDYGTGPSDGRFVWLVVLALVALETYLRRRTSPGAEYA